MQFEKEDTSVTGIITLEGDEPHIIHQALIRQISRAALQGEAQFAKHSPIIEMANALLIDNGMNATRLRLRSHQLRILGDIVYDVQIQLSASQMRDQARELAIELRGAAELIDGDQEFADNPTIEQLLRMLGSANDTEGQNPL